MLTIICTGCCCHCFNFICLPCNPTGDSRLFQHFPSRRFSAVFANRTKTPKTVRFVPLCWLGLIFRGPFCSLFPQVIYVFIIFYKSHLVLQDERATCMYAIHFTWFALWPSFSFFPFSVFSI